MHQRVVISHGLQALKWQKLFMSADLCANTGKLDVTWRICLFIFSNLQTTCRL